LSSQHRGPASNHPYKAIFPCLAILSSRVSRINLANQRSWGVRLTGESWETPVPFVSCHTPPAWPFSKWKHLPKSWRHSRPRRLKLGSLCSSPRDGWRHHWLRFGVFLKNKEAPTKMPVISHYNPPLSMENLLILRGRSPPRDPSLCHHHHHQGQIEPQSQAADMNSNSHEKSEIRKECGSLGNLVATKVKLMSDSIFGEIFLCHALTS